MKFIGKDKQVKNGCKKTTCYFLGLNLWSKEKSPVRCIVKFFGIPVLSYRYNSPASADEKVFEDMDFFVTYVQSKTAENSKQNMLWLDHVLGGGTETYSQNQFSKLKDTQTIFRLQYNPFYDCYMLTVPQTAAGCIPNFGALKKTLQHFVFSEICVNNLVCWHDIPEMLALIQNYKTKNTQVKISMRGHDFYSICPSFNLLNCDNEFCRVSYKNGCENCIAAIQSFQSKRSREILFFGFKTIADWRKMWGEFFSCLDELIVFSHSTKEIFLQAYPILAEKIKIIPHEVSPLPKVSVKVHEGINIAMLGNINSTAKGCLVIAEMCLNNPDADIHLFAVGAYTHPPQNLVVTGKYSPAELPLLMEKYQIDIVFIPSICPETFSYTTSEAMSMGLPVVCYNMGAPAERVKKYAKGLVLKTIKPAENLLEIKIFVEKLRSGRL